MWGKGGLVDLPIVRSFVHKLATTYACNAAAALSSHPSSAVLTPVSILRTTKTVFFHNMHL